MFIAPDNLRHWRSGWEVINETMMDNRVPPLEMVCEKLNEWFDAPCNYSNDTFDFAEFINENDWCEQNCDNGRAICWMHLFELLWEKEKDQWTAYSLTDACAVRVTESFDDLIHHVSYDDAQLGREK